MKLTILGTGNAVVTRCYNTCFIFDDNGKYFLVDGGGGNGILRQLEDANIPWKEIRDIFITHKHLDHLTGIIWMIRMICQNMKRGTYEGEANLYGHAEVLQMAHDIACMVLYRDADRFKPYEKHHSTVKDACELAQTLGVENLILYHTEDKTIEHRKELYTAEGKPYFSGNLFVPDDLETFTL